MRLDNVGDAILTTGLLDVLRQRWPKARISVFCSEAAAPVFRLCPYVNETIPLAILFPNVRRSSQGRNALEEFQARYDGQFDVLISPRHGPDHYGTALYAAASRAPVRIAFRQTDFSGGLDPNETYTSLIDRPAQGELAADILGHILKTLGIEKDMARATIIPTRRAVNRARSLLSQRKSVAIALGAALPHKIWPPENFAIVAMSLVKAGYSVVLLGTQSEGSLADRFRAHVSEEILDMVGKTSLDEAAAIIAECDLFIGNDSGPKHVAAAVGTPIVEVGWLNDRTPGFPYDHGFEPIGVPSIVLRPALFDAAQTMACKAVSSIAPSDVIKAAAELLSRP